MSFASDNEKSIGEWSKLKLAFLESYLDSYLKATTKAIYKYYIDCFSGYCEYTHRETGETIPGSCKVALSLYRKFSKYFFIEMDANRIADLNNLKELYPDRPIETLSGDCNKLIRKVLKEINKASPTFVFLDTDGIHIDWKTIELLSKWKTELLINFPYNMSIKRSLPLNKSKLPESTRLKMNLFYGSNEWENIYYNFEGYTRIERDYMMINSYMENLKGLGYDYVIVSDKFRNSNDAPLYNLIFASNHALGEKIMKHVFNKQFNTQLTMFDMI